MSSSPPNNGIMTIGEVADYFKVTERTIYPLRGTKQIPALKVGGSYRFSKITINSWMKKKLRCQGKSDLRSNSMTDVLDRICLASNTKTIGAISKPG